LSVTGPAPQRSTCTPTAEETPSQCGGFVIIFKVRDALLEGAQFVRHAPKLSEKVRRVLPAEDRVSLKGIARFGHRPCSYWGIRNHEPVGTCPSVKNLHTGSVVVPRERSDRCGVRKPALRCGGPWTYRSLAHPHAERI
jgi:hypothetical protein